MRFGVIAVWSLLCWVATAHAQSPHLIVISMDTTRYDALSCNGHPPDVRHTVPTVSPNLDALAANGVRFAAFYTHAPTTLNSHTSLMTGLDPHRHGVPANGYPYVHEASTLA